MGLSRTCRKCVGPAGCCAGRKTGKRCYLNKEAGGVKRKDERRSVDPYVQLVTEQTHRGSSGTGNHHPFFFFSPSFHSLHKQKAQSSFLRTCACL